MTVPFVAPLIERRRATWPAAGVTAMTAGAPPIRATVTGSGFRSAAATPDGGEAIALSRGNTRSPA